MTRWGAVEQYTYCLHVNRCPQTTKLHAWRALARQARKNDGLFVHRRGAGRNLPSSRASSGVDALSGASEAAKRDLDTPIAPFVMCTRTMSSNPHETQELWVRTSSEWAAGSEGGEV